jgi:uncharacterized membrane protein
MTEFLLALAAFFLSHVLPQRLGWRDRIAARFGERAYVIGYSLLSLALLAWLIHAAVTAPVLLLWNTEPWHYHFALALMFPAALLFAGGAAAANPLSVAFRSEGYDPARPGILGVTRHPMLWAFALWSLAHLVPNGDFVSLVMFGGFALFAVAGMKLLDRRRRRRLGARWEELAAPTAVFPFAAYGRHGARRWSPASLAATLLGGTALYALALWLHPLVIGPDPAALLLA